MSQPIDSTAVGSWCGLALDALRTGREEIDAINVFPVADADTGTNLHRTLDAAARALDDAQATTAAGALHALARGALLGACGNSGTILAQLLRGAARAVADGSGHGEETADQDREGEQDRDGEQDGDGGAGAGLLCRALRQAADSAYAAVAHPVEGTMLSVASAAADAAESARRQGARAAGTVARAAYDGARAALAETTERLDVLRRAGVVDAGGEGLVRILGALVGERPGPAAGGPHAAAPAYTVGMGSTVAGAAATAGGRAGGPEYEVMYLLDGADEAGLCALRTALDRLGDSLVIGGGEGLWSVHVHTDDAGAAVEAGVAAGRPHRIRIVHLTTEGFREHREQAAHGEHGEGAAHGVYAEHGEQPGRGGWRGGYGARAGREGEGRRRVVISVVRGAGMAQLCEEAGAIAVPAPEPDTAEHRLLAEAVRSARTAGAQEVVLLPNGTDPHVGAARAAEEARALGLRTAVIPTRAAVQGIAALAVHEESLPFDEDVVAMTAAARATRYGEITVAEHRSWTTAGICQAGDVLGLVDGDVAVIGRGIPEVAAEVLERMLAAGGELVTLVLGAHCPGGLAARLEQQVRRGHLAVDTVAHEGRQYDARLLIGVE